MVSKRTISIAIGGLQGLVFWLGPAVLHEAGAGSCGGVSSHASCQFGWTFAGGGCFQIFGAEQVPGVGTAALERMAWADAEDACRQMGPDTHLASVSNEEQQLAVARLAGGNLLVWIGLNDVEEPGNFVWSDNEPGGNYTNWARGEPNGAGDFVGVNGDLAWWMAADLEIFGSNAPFICEAKAEPVEASGGAMIGCVDGHWVMGTPYSTNNNTKNIPDLPPTTAYGLYEERIYTVIKPRSVRIVGSIPTPAECAALVHRDHPTASAAEYSNDAKEECYAVFDA